MPLRLGMPLPSLAGATEWINGPPAAGSFHGARVLVHFWAVSCHICHGNMPTVARWRDTYGPRGLVTIAVHMPRQESDLDLDAVRRAAADLGIVEPCAIDNRHAVADAFANQWVPAYFLFDHEGALRGRTGGEAGLALLESALRRQFGDGNQAGVDLSIGQGLRP